MAGGAAILGVVGSVIGTVGKLKEQGAEVDAYRQNAQWLQEEADFAKESTQRELLIKGNEYAQHFGAVTSGIGRGGVDLSGSPLLVLADQKLQEAQELEAIKKQGAFQYREASLKAQSEAGMASSIASGESFTMISGVLGVGSAAANYFGRSKSYA